MVAWKRVVFGCECDEFGNCPVCGIEYAECDCPGPTEEDVEYQVIDGVLHGMRLPPEEWDFDSYDPDDFDDEERE